MHSFEVTLQLPPGLRAAALVISLISLVASAGVAIWVARKEVRVRSLINDQTIESRRLEKELDRKLEELKVWASSYDTPLLEKRLVEYKKLDRKSVV